MNCSFANGREELVQRQQNRVRQNSRSDWDADSSDEEMNKEPQRFGQNTIHGRLFDSAAIVLHTGNSQLTRTGVGVEKVTAISR